MMSTFKRASTIGGQPKQNVLAPLRAAQIVNSRTILPAGEHAFPPSSDPPNLVRDYVHGAGLPPCARPGTLCAGIEAVQGDGLR